LTQTSLQLTKIKIRKIRSEEKEGGSEEKEGEREEKGEVKPLPQNSKASKTMQHLRIHLLRLQRQRNTFSLSSLSPTPSPFHTHLLCRTQLLEKRHEGEVCGIGGIRKRCVGKLECWAGERGDGNDLRRLYKAVRK
jgi:hypothetical protein